MEDLITDLVKVLHARRLPSDSNDCLLKQCEKLVKLHANNSNGNFNISTLANDDGQETKNCVNCPGLKKFEIFFKSVQKFLSSNLDKYHDFIQKQFEFKSTSGKNDWNIRAQSTINQKMDACNVPTKLNCQKLVLDFRFLAGFKVCTTISHFRKQRYYLLCLMKCFSGHDRFIQFCQRYSKRHFIEIAFNSNGR